MGGRKPIKRERGGNQLTKKGDWGGELGGEASPSQPTN